ncbi:MAG: VWA domain-containing protein [Bacteroidales bacterium]
MKRKLIPLVSFVFIFLTNSCYMAKKSHDYYGIDLESNKYVFLIDISGSMENKIEKDAKGVVLNVATNVAANTVGKVIGGSVGNMVGNKIKKSLTKLEKAKKNLIPVINGFTEENYFTVITFENDIKLWRKELIPATSANKKLAVAFIKSLKSGGGTNISDALEEAFKLAGKGVNDETEVLDVETVFLLSDGEPSAGQYRSTQQILQKVEEWNELNRLQIHTVGLGDNHDEDFMRKMAVDNNGVYINK